MNRLSPEAERLFQLARTADDPDKVEVNRVGRALAHRLATGGGLATGAAVLSHSASAGAALSVTKVITILVVTGAVSTAGFFAVHSRKPPSATIASVVTKAAAGPGMQTQAAVSLPLAEPVAPVSHANALVDSGRSTPSRGSAHAASSAVIEETADQLQAETADLQQAQAALRSGDTGSALRLLSAQDTTYRSGVLQQERSAARVLALCQSGSVAAARAEAARFEKRWPNSPLTSRVRSACAKGF